MAMTVWSWPRSLMTSGRKIEERTGGKIAGWIAGKIVAKIGNLTDGKIGRPIGEKTVRWIAKTIADLTLAAN